MAEETIVITGILNGIKKIHSNHSQQTFVNFYVDQIKCKSFGSCADLILGFPHNVTVQMDGHYTNSQRGWGTEFVVEKAEILSSAPSIADCQSTRTAQEANVKPVKASVTLNTTKVENLTNIKTASGRMFVNFTVGPHKCKSFGVTAERLLERMEQNGGKHTSLVLDGYFSSSAKYGTEFVCENVTWTLPALEVPAQVPNTTIPFETVSLPQSVSDALQARIRRDEEKRAAEESEDYERSFKLYSAYENSLLKGLKYGGGTTAAQVRAIDAILDHRKTLSESQTQPQLGELCSLQAPSIDQNRLIGEQPCEI